MIFSVKEDEMEALRWKVVSTCHSLLHTIHYILFSF